MQNTYSSTEAAKDRALRIHMGDKELQALKEELEYKEYTFTANELPSFKSFRIKFLLTSTNQAFVPRLTSLKVIATA